MVCRQPLTSLLLSSNIPRISYEGQFYQYKSPPNDSTRPFLGVCVCVCLWFWLALHPSLGSSDLEYSTAIVLTSSLCQTFVDIFVLDVAALETSNKQDFAGKIQYTGNGKTQTMCALVLHGPHESCYRGALTV